MSCRYSEEDLVCFARQYAKQYWNRDFDIRIELVNRDWKRKLASYHYNRKTGDKFIRMSKVVNRRHTNKEVLGSLLHEMVHWVLHTSGKPFNDDSQEFVAECVRVGAPLSKTKAAQRAYKNYAKV